MTPAAVAGWLAAAAVLLLAGCLGAGRDSPAAGLPERPALYAAVPAGHTGYDNRTLGALFTKLTHDAEWGAGRPHLLRYEAPVVVTLEGPGAEAYRAFLARYLRLLRDEAQVPIALGQTGTTLAVRLVEGGAFARLLPAAACVLVPGNLSWKDWTAQPDRLGGDALVAAREIVAMTVFLPADAPPHATRACLIEEIAQALGPINDLYGLGPSIFNDDFAHVWPTRLDLLMLRVLYDGAMRTGMSRAVTQRTAEAVLERVNPAGRRAPPLPDPRPRGAGDWAELVDGVGARGLDAGAVLGRARDALDHAEAVLPGRAEHCHSLTLLGRILSRREPEAALALLDRAMTVCRAAHGADDIRLALIGVERAAVLLTLDRPAEALAATEALEAVLAGHGLDERLAARYALRSRAYADLGERERARAERDRARAWGLTALGRDIGPMAAR